MQSRHPMGVTVRRLDHRRIYTTLLDLIQAVNEETEDDELAVATVFRVVNSGRAWSMGAFKGARLLIR